MSVTHSSLLVRCLNAPNGRFQSSMHESPPLDTVEESCVSACNRHGLRVQVCEASDAPTMLLQTITQPTQHKVHLVILRVVATFPMDVLLKLLQTLRQMSRQLFICVYSPRVSDHAMHRYQCFSEGASMVTNSIEDVSAILTKLASEDAALSRSMSSSRRTYACPFCGKNGLTEDALWSHCPLHHINEKNRNDIACPICTSKHEKPYRSSTPFQVHLHNAHGPPGRGELPSEFRNPETTLYCFALVVCRHPLTKLFLLVQEFACSGYWLPGGRVDAGETPVEAAIRETREEAGIDVRLTGLLKLEYHPKSDSSGRQYVRMRFVFLAEPVNLDQKPKSIPDYESAGATWCSADEVKQLPLRGPEPLHYFEYVATGGNVYPLDGFAMK
ncbi:unnamed protein product [Aphanomyces euteiches]|uniref:Nudix hydrolase domain-containing protein n=1 Tax=Aphanomyces euteiches TaxID=100861 RepID=A0A6G0X0M0_9STRA|nr:hypothetical protein Ae201684_009633 [Aphanomyces euteiches]KAH9085741.1 hypothetical protein Ae201684P_005444 [Aphanomyces euteiches]KAH9157877.1 hypothetical protein AeRB84_000349 [Aphanomyces euteiches]